jgi:hypothetical protein
VIDVALMLILIVLVTVIVVPAVVLLGIGRVDDRRSARKRVDAPGADGDLPELLRRPLRAGRAV